VQKLEVDGLKLYSLANDEITKAKVAKAKAEEVDQLLQEVKDYVADIQAKVKVASSLLCTPSHVPCHCQHVCLIIITACASSSSPHAPCHCPHVCLIVVTTCALSSSQHAPHCCCGMCLVVVVAYTLSLSQHVPCHHYSLCHCC